MEYDWKTILGTLNADGSVQSWPERNIRGGAYSRPASTLGLSPTRFCVLPVGNVSVEETDALRSAFEAAHSPQGESAPEAEPDPAPKGKGGK